MIDKNKVMKKIDELEEVLPSSYKLVLKVFRKIVKSDIGSERWKEIEGIIPKKAIEGKDVQALPFEFLSWNEQIYDLSMGIGMRLGWYHSEHPNYHVVWCANHFINQLASNINEVLKTPNMFLKKE